MRFLSQFESVILMAAVLLIPAIPAMLMYKVLPAEDVRIRGKLLGFQVKAAGSFAGYVLLVLVAFQIQQGAQAELAPFETWTISAVVKIDDPRDSFAGTAITLVPSLWAIDQTSRSTATVRFTVPLPRQANGSMPPQIRIEKPPYLPASYPVGLEDQVDPFTNLPYRVYRDFESRRMVIQDTLVLRRMEEYRPAGEAFSPRIIPGPRPAG